MSASATEASPPSALMLGVNIAPLADPMFVGVFLSIVLWGITVAQTATYYHLNRDGWSLQTLVGTLFVMDSVNSIMLILMAHVYLLENFGNPAILATLPWSGICEVGLNVLVCFLVELFFARRLYLFNQGRIVVPGLIVVFAVAGLVSGILLVVSVSKTPTVAGLAQPTMKIETALCNAFEAVSDLIVAVGLSWEFHRGRSHIKSTNSMLDRLLGHTVARGGLMTVAQFLNLALYVAQPTKLNWMPVHFSLSKVSLISMLAILNGRESLRGALSDSVTDTQFYTESIVSSQPPGRPNAQFQLKSLPSAPGTTSVRVHPEGVTTYEEEEEFLASKA
ncbi:unnamed protein product [Mycena citricolor]|uniref:DUF6534 domain-containing protein n=1 Tax=Mycena citricolor TaxID=2018698 RepID=A0AAD2HUE9_9AGAR|nr:unnamed protein product [Mycena citricolor]